ncbi:hypothetical protein M8C13_38520 [Crossiella sp. SN42]|nr:hypothetical protein [Crossiella sp. SN42]
MAAAVAPGEEDRLGAVVAEEIADWVRVWRTRQVLLAGTRPWCSGSTAARRVLERLLATENAPVYVLGAIPASRRVLAGLRAGGAVFVASLDAVPEQARVLFSQAGVSLAVRAEAAARGLAITDATCPVVAATAGEVRRLAEQGETVVLVADPGQAAVPGLAGQAPEHVRMVADLPHVPGLEVADPRRVGVVVAPGAPVAVTRPVAEAVRNRFGHVLPQDPATLCAEPADRRAAVLRLAADTDVVLVAGPAGADSRMLLGLVEGAGARAYRVSSAQEVRPAWLGGMAAVGITASQGAPEGLVAELLQGLSGLGPMAAVEVAIRSAAVAVPVTAPGIIAVVPRE